MFHENVERQRSRVWVPALMSLFKATYGTVTRSLGNLKWHSPALVSSNEYASIIMVRNCLQSRELLRGGE